MSAVDIVDLATVRETPTAVRATIRNASAVSRLNDPAVRDAAAQAVADALGLNLQSFFSWTITASSVDQTCSVTLHKD